MMSAGRLPNLVIAGVGGAGTTSLFAYLAQHHDVCPSKRKELRFFSPLKYGEELGPLEGYARHVAHCSHEKYAMEATPGYFYGTRRLVTVLKDTLRDPHVIVSLRDPVERLWSSYRYVKSRMEIDQGVSLREYIATAEELRRTGRDRLRENRPFWGLSGGFYSEFIQDWFDALGPRFRVVFFEHLASDPMAVVVELCDWLEIDPAPATRFDYSAENRTVSYRRRSLQRIALAVNRRGEVVFRQRPRLKRLLRSLYYRVNSAASESSFPEETRRYLRDLYAPSNRALAAELARRGYGSLPAWLREPLPKPSRTT
jgi:hypothetical protein